MRGPPFERLAPVYDRVYSWKDYPLEVRRIEELVRRWGPRPARTLLDVGCGTGGHLRHLSRRYRCWGVDASPEMLSVARREVPNVRLVRGSMPEFDLQRRFDVIVCLFSAIGYVRNVADLRRTVRTFARHLNPGGVVIVEPWLTKAVWRPGAVHLLSIPSKTEPIARMTASSVRGARSRMTMHYLAAERGRIRYWVERHEMTLFDRKEMAEAFRAAGLTVRRVPSRFGYGTDRGLYVGTAKGNGRRTPENPSTGSPAERRRMT